MHGSNRLGGNSLSDLLVFGRRAGLHAALYAKNFGGQLTVDAGPGGVGRARDAGAVRAGRRREPLRDPGRPAGHDAGPGRPHPHRVGAEGSAQEDRGRSRSARARCGSRAAGVYNPGWHTALDLQVAAHRGRVLGGGRAGAQGEPRRPHARRPSVHRRHVGQGQRGPAAARRRASRSPASRCRRCRPSSRRSSRRGSRCRPSRCRCSAADPRGGDFRTTGWTPTRAWSSSTSSIASRPRRRPTWPAAGTARPASAARAAPRSTASRG